VYQFGRCIRAKTYIGNRICAIYDGDVVPLLGESHLETILGGSMLHSSGARRCPKALGTPSPASPRRCLSRDRPSPTIYSTSPLSIKCGYIGREKERVDAGRAAPRVGERWKIHDKLSFCSDFLQSS
jgi:hypothetical protein